LRHVHLFAALLRAVRNDGQLLAKHIITILRVANRNLKFLTLPLDAIGPDFFIQYDATMDHRARHLESDPARIESKFKNNTSKIGVFQDTNLPRGQIAACLLITFSLIYRTFSLELFAMNDDLTQGPIDTTAAYELFESHPLIAETARRDAAFAAALQGLHALSGHGRSEFKKFEDLAAAVGSLPARFAERPSASAPAPAPAPAKARFTDHPSGPAKGRGNPPPIDLHCSEIRAALSKLTDRICENPLDTTRDPAAGPLFFCESGPAREGARRLAETFDRLRSVPDTAGARDLLECADQTYAAVKAMPVRIPFRGFADPVDPWILRSCFWLIGEAFLRMEH
jgi:hypothetical protein